MSVQDEFRYAELPSRPSSRIGLLEVTLLSSDSAVEAGLVRLVDDFPGPRRPNERLQVE